MLRAAGGVFFCFSLILSGISGLGKRKIKEKETLLAELIKKYQTLLEDGYEPEAAYEAVIGGIGDIFELVDGIAGEAAAEQKVRGSESINRREPETKDTGSPAGFRIYEVLPYGAAGFLFLFWIQEFFFPVGPKERTVLPLLVLGADVGAGILWLIFRGPRLSSVKEIPMDALAKAAGWCVAAVLFFQAVLKPHLAKGMWLIPLGALAISQLISLWTSYRNEKKRGGTNE